MRARDPGSGGGKLNLDVTPGFWFVNTALQPRSVLTNTKCMELFGLSLAGTEVDVKSGGSVST